MALNLKKPAKAAAPPTKPAKAAAPPTKPAKAAAPAKAVDATELSSVKSAVREQLKALDDKKLFSLCKPNGVDHAKYNHLPASTKRMTVINSLVGAAGRMFADGKSKRAVTEAFK